MHTIPFAIHGFGRIGRALARAAWGRRVSDDPLSDAVSDDLAGARLELVAVNDLVGADQLARLLARDSVHGRFPASVRAAGDELLIGEGSGARDGEADEARRVQVFRQPERRAVPWEETPARVVVDCSGGAVRGGAGEHLRPGDDGPRHVLVSALAEGVDVTVCRGLNDDALEPSRHRLVSGASCTTNCLALVLKVLDERFGVQRALMNEVHSYTGNQSLVDGPHDDPRRGRAASMNIVPTHSAAPAALEELMPALRGRLAGQAVRVPTPDVALLDLVATVEQDVDEIAVQDAYVEAAAGPLRGLLDVCDEPVVSSDLVGDAHSAVVDLPLVQVTGDLVRVAAWYDNETGYAHRLAELVARLGAAPIGRDSPATESVLTKGNA